MKILFTGSSSFTGYWFIKELVQAGHEVFATFTAASVESYDGVRGERVKQLVEYCHPVWDCTFGQERFLSLIKDEAGWDLLCHHAADVTNYKSLDFDIGNAVSANTCNLTEVLEALTATGCNRLVITGSVFEQNEGVGEQPLKAFSPYGLSKGLTAEVFKYWCQHYGFSLGKFIIPNPFGPYEDPRFTSYLAKTWLRREKASVNTPRYIRDNIHVSLLAIAYGRFCETLESNAGFVKTNPTGYVESQGAFTKRVAEAIKYRLDVPCEIELINQTVFEEPKARSNYDFINSEGTNWSESTAWDELADYYLSGANG